MKPSFQIIDYALRPAKHTERRMLCDIFRRLAFFNRLTDYTYVGFGGIAFSDFVLFHKALGIRDMISIEREVAAAKRISENKPFNSIRVVNKSSSEVLPALSWKKPHILWLDYDDPLNTEMLLDVATVASHASSGTFLTLSFACVQAPEIDIAKREGGNSFERFTTTFGKDRIPDNADEVDLRGWKYGQLGKKMLFREIQSKLAIRNIGLQESKKLEFREVCTIEYSDGAKMVSIAGVFVSEEDSNTFDMCEFKQLDFMPKKRVPIRIDVPKLTLREIKALEVQLPLKEKAKLNHQSIPKKDADSFVKLYRYLPNFSVLEN